MRRALLWTLTALVSTAAAASSAHAAPWRVVAEAETDRSYEIVRLGATVEDATRAGVRLTGYLVGGEIKVSCTDGTDTESRTSDLRGQGLQQVRMPMGAPARCEIVVRVFGPDGVEAKLYADGRASSSRAAVHAA